MQFIAMFSHFSVLDSNLIKALERFFVAKYKTLDIRLIAMTMEYCRKMRYLSTKVFDLSATHFEQNSALYGPTEMFFVLRPFGQLHYVPHNVTPLFDEVEHVLSSKYLNIFGSNCFTVLGFMCTK